VQLLNDVDARVDRHRDLGAVFIRLLVGGHLLYMCHDNVVSWERMLHFRDFLAAHGFPFPLLSANVSVWAQFTASLLFLAGWLVRPAAAVMVVNFLIALAMVHTATPYAVTFPALVMLAGALFLFFNGAGALSVERLLARRGGGAASERGEPRRVAAS
jgi:putative oxidoreductase